MALTTRKVKTYAKLIGIGLLVAFILIFMFSNRQRVPVKFMWWEIWEAPLFGIIFLVANLGILVYLVGRKVRKVINEFRQLRQEDRSRQKLVRQIKQEVDKEQNSQP